MRNNYQHSFTRYLIIQLLLALLFLSNPLFSQEIQSPRYGIEPHKWEQLQSKPLIKQKTKSVTLAEGGFTNGGFENGDLFGWVYEDVVGPFLPLQTGPGNVDVYSGFFITDPTEGKLAAYHGWDGETGSIRLAQDLTLPVTAISLEFDYRAAWDLLSYGATKDRVFSISIEPSGGGTAEKTDTILTAVASTINNDTGNLNGSIDISAWSGMAVRISFNWSVTEDFSGPALFQLDDVFIKKSGKQLLITESISFGNSEVGNSTLPSIVNLRSVGTEDVIVTEISDPGDQFILSNVPSLPVTISPGEVETFEVTFSPTVEGISETIVTVSSDDSENAVQGIILSGNGVILNSALSGVFYGSTGNNDGGRLITINSTTGEGSVLGPTGSKAVPALAINSIGEIFALDTDQKLYRLDASSGASVLVGQTNFTFSTPAIAFDRNDVLYVLNLELIMDPFSVEWKLFTLNTETAEATTIAAVPGADWRGMAFDPTDGTLWASTVSEDIFAIDPTTGLATLIGKTGLSSGVPDIQFDNDGNLYGVTGGGGGENSFISIDKNSGQATVIGSIGVTSVSGLASINLPLVGSHIGIIPNKLMFDLSEVNDVSSPLVVTIRSVGTESLTVSEISDPEAPFSIVNKPTLPLILNPGMSESFEVVFSPTSEGSFISSFMVTSDDADTNVNNVHIEGEAIIIQPAEPGVCYGSTGWNDGGRLITIDGTTGAGTLIGPTGLLGVPALAINSEGYMYGISTQDYNLYKIDAMNGISILAMGVGVWMPAIAFDDNDVLYGLAMDWDVVKWKLYTLDITSGILSEVAIAELPEGVEWRGMDFDPTDGSLWGSTTTDQIYTIDPNSGTSTLVGNSGFGATPDIHFDSNGNLFGTRGGGQTSNTYISINKTSGAGKRIGSIGFTSVSGLAYYGVSVSVDENATQMIPNEFSLDQNYPNPFNPSTVINYSIAQKSFVNIKVFDIIGREVTTLINKEQTVGNYQVEFNASNLTSGVYFYRIKAGDFSATKKMILMK